MRSTHEEHSEALLLLYIKPSVPLLSHVTDWSILDIQLSRAEHHAHKLSVKHDWQLAYDEQFRP